MPTTPPLLLIVDDDHALHRMLELEAETVGLAVVHAMTGEDALLVAAERKPDAILLDMGLPDFDGRDVLARLKTMVALAGIPIIVYSSNAEYRHRVNVLELGAVDYFDKPIDAKFLMQAIVRHIEKHRAGE